MVINFYTNKLAQFDNMWLEFLERRRLAICWLNDCTLQVIHADRWSKSTARTY